MKRIYTFNVKKTVELEEDVKSKNEAGEEVITKKKVKKEVNNEFFIKKPSRNLREEAALYYAGEVSKGLKKGLMSSAMLQKRYVDDGGIYSDKEKGEIEKLQKELESLQKKNQELSSKDKKTKKDEENIEKVNTEFSEIAKKLTEMMSYEQDLFSNTAESFARNKSILFWIVFLSYKVEGDKEVPFFEDGSFSERLEKYDELSESEDDLITDIVEKFTYIVAVWSNNSEIDTKELNDALKLADSQKSDKEKAE